MRLDRHAIVDWQHVLRAGRHRHDAIHFRPERHTIPRFAQAIAPFKAAILPPWNIHEQVQAVWREPDLHTQARQPCMQVIPAIIVICRATKQAITFIVTRRDQRVMPPR